MFNFRKLFNVFFGTGIVDYLTFWGGGGGGGSQTQSTVSELDPTVKPYVSYGLGEAQKLYQTAGPSYYPGQTYISPSTQTQQALQAAQSRALQGSPLVPQAQQTISGLQQAVNPALAGFQGLQAGGQNLALPGTQTTAGGAYLGSNPYFNAALMQGAQAATTNYLDAINQARSGASLAGRYGSGAATELQSRAQQNLANALAQQAGQLAYSQYGMERGLQEGALGRLSDISGQQFQQRLAATSGLGSLAEQQAQRQMAAAQAAPGLAGADYADIQQLMNVGQTAEDYQRQALEADIGRYEYGQNLPYTKLQSFLSAAYGAPMGQTTTARTSGGGK